MANLALTEEPVAEHGDATNQDLAGKSGELGADFHEDLDEEHEAEEELDADLLEDVEADEELEEDLDKEHEADEDGSSAYGPYLARKMSCLGSRTSGVKDTPFLGSVWGTKEAGKCLPPGELRRDLRSTY